MKQRYYIAPVLERTEAGETYWSSLLNDLINIQTGEGFQEWHQDARHYSLCLVWAEDVTHTTIAAHPDVIVASPLFDDDADRVVKMGNIANINAVKPRLEAIGLNAEWMTGLETYKDVLRYVVMNYWLGQVCSGRNETHMLTLIQQNLTTQVKDIPAATRNAVQTWMQNRGLATGWITMNTTVRQIIHFILMNLNLPSIKCLKDMF